MKKVMTLLLVIGMMAATAVSATAQTQTQNENNVVFLMDEEPYCTIHYDVVNLAEIIAKADTLIDVKRFYRIMESYPYAEDGPDELAFLVLIPHYKSKQEAEDEGIEAIVVQEDEDEVIVSISLLTSVGWMEHDEEDEDGLLNLFVMIATMQHMDEVSE